MVRYTSYYGKRITLSINTATHVSTPEQARRMARNARRALAVEAAYLRELSTRAPVTKWATQTSYR